MNFLWSKSEELSGLSSPDSKACVSYLCSHSTSMTSFVVTEQAQLSSAISYTNLGLIKSYISSLAFPSHLSPRCKWKILSISRLFQPLEALMRQQIDQNQEQLFSLCFTDGSFSLNKHPSPDALDLPAKDADQNVTHSNKERPNGNIPTRPRCTPQSLTASRR